MYDFNCLFFYFQPCYAMERPRVGYVEFKGKINGISRKTIYALALVSKGFDYIGGLW